MYDNIDENDNLAKECFFVYNGVLTHLTKKKLLKIINMAYNKGYNDAKKESD